MLKVVKLNIPVRGRGTVIRRGGFRGPLGRPLQFIAPLSEGKVECELRTVQWWGKGPLPSSRFRVEALPLCSIAQAGAKVLAMGLGYHLLSVRVLSECLWKIC